MNESAPQAFANPEPGGTREDLLRACLTRVNEGSEDALSSIYDHTSSLVYGIAVSMLGDHSDAEEVTLDVYSQIWRGASSYQPERGTVIGWLTTVARNRAIDRLRSRRRRSEQDVESLPEKPAAAPSPEESTIAGEQQQRVRTALAALPENQRHLIELACYGGYSHSELAEKTGLPLGTVKTRMRTGLSKLRELLAAVGEPAW